MEKKRGTSLFIFVFLFFLIVSFPFHYLKDFIFTKINQKFRGAVQVYSSDLSLGIGGVSLERVYLLYQKLFFQVDSISILPSISALLRGTLGVSADVENLYGADIDLVVGRGWKSVFVSISTDDLRLEKIPIVTKTISSISGPVEIDGSGKLKDLNPPFEGNASLRVKIPELKIPTKFKLNTGTGELALPPVPSLSPGIDGEFGLEGKSLRIRKLNLGKSGQALWGTVTRHVQLERNIDMSQLDLVVELSFGEGFKSHESIQNIISSGLLTPYMKTTDSISFRLRGTKAFPQMMPL